MVSEITKGITRRLGAPDLFEKLAEQISGSELNSLLLEILCQKTNQISPADLLRSYEENRFVKPVAYDWIPFLEWELELLRFAKDEDFQPLELSPVSPLGSCSVLATVHQHKVLSALRGTEVTADATNVLALESSLRRRALLKKNAKSPERVRLCTTHRHTRTQVFDFPGFTPHFKIFCLTTAGRDEGDFMFEKESLIEHLRFYKRLLDEKLGIEKSQIRLVMKDLRQAKEENALFETLQQSVLEAFPEMSCTIQKIEEANYYQGLQFKIMLTIGDREFDIADGGFVDWTQQLLHNRKERLFISGLGTELLYKLLTGQL